MFALGICAYSGLQSSSIALLWRVERDGAKRLLVPFFSAGAPILKSYDLVSWEYIGRSVPGLPPTSRFCLISGRPIAYGQGVWASTLKYRESNGLFYFYSAIRGPDKTYVYTTKSPTDIWTAHPPIERFYYDLGLLIDDDDTMYIAYGIKTIEVAQLSLDGLTEVTSKAMVHVSDGYLEGARMYKINGAYYIWLTKSFWAFFTGMRCPIGGSGSPHQGGLVDTPDGKWYYMAFSDAYPAGRIALSAPVVFDAEGWPKVVADYPDAQGQYNFTQPSLEPCWEWNHSPDNSKWAHKDGQLVLRTGTVTHSLHLATNTLTLRTVGPGSMATFCIDALQMRDGDRADVAMFRDESAYIGIHKDADNLTLVYLHGAKVIKAQTPLANHRVWLRTKVDLRAAHADEYASEMRYATFEYNYDDTTFKKLGLPYQLTKSTAGYVGYRFGLFNFATQALGGEIRVSHCDLEPWDLSE
ncbi:glycosyl hydrolase [Aspergillus keveii]|uniref:Glycosyl hydrolase n=1 Tax=Aspergillus keveii TaxID=714993 RepID=A0ABR4FZP6_9EURO